MLASIAVTRARSCRRTIDPRIADDYSAFWQLELSNLGLDSLVFKANALHYSQFFSITRCVYIVSKPHILLDCLG